MARFNLAYATVVLFASACTFNEGGVSVSGDDSADASVNGDPDAEVNDDPDASPPQPDATVVIQVDAMEPCPGDALPFVPLNIGRCGMPEPGDTVILTGGPWEIDTDTGMLYNGAAETIPLSSMLVAQDGGPELRVVAVDSWTQTADLWVVGSRPLVLVSFGNLALDAAINVYAAGALPGPGGGVASLCTLGTGHDGVSQDAGDNKGGSGGGGGGFGAIGGAGGRVNLSSGSATPGGMVDGNASLVPLRGGCSGGAGGGSGGPGGGGGGAIQIVAGGTFSMTTNATVSARGAGGLPPQPSSNQPSQSGGGGGGSGGAVLVQATTISVAPVGTITAQGGGGGEGTRFGTSVGNGGGDPGMPGRMYTATVAPGGAEEVCAGGDGGDGGFEATAAGAGFEGFSDEDLAAGGGGGGGAVGRIRLVATTLSLDPAAVISPDHSL